MVQLSLAERGVSLGESQSADEGATDPLLKWAGGKRRLLSHLLPLAPPIFNRYFEPFLGGGAMFFRLRPERSYLADWNGELINCYVQVRDNTAVLIRRLRTLRNSEKSYYAVRASKPRGDIQRAARLLYLTTLAFNGIYRVNQKGQFNVPYGRKCHLTPCDPSKLWNAANALQNASLRVADFADAVADAQAGDFIYFDPPYTVAHGNNGFLKYNEKIMQWDDQIRLANLAHAKAREGCKVIVSNADHPSVLRLYRDFQVKRIHRPSIMAASSIFRRPITECAFYN